MKQKVWQVIWGLKDGGAEHLARVYAESVNEEKFDTTIVTMYPYKNTANAKRAQAAGIHVISVFKRRNLFTRGVRVLLGRWYVPWRLKRFLATENPNVIHFNSKMVVEFLPLEKELVGRKLVYTCHSEVNKYFSLTEDAAVRQLLKCHDVRLIGLREEMKEELDARFNVNNSVVIRNGVNIECFRKWTRPNVEIRKVIGIPQNAFVVGHIGRFAQVKNHRFLLQVFAEIAKKVENAHLLLIGNGELEAEIRKLIVRMELDAKVTMLSHRTDIPELLSAMDVMVFPSFYEGLSVTLVEAQASGLRCIVSDSVKPENFLLDTTIPMSLNADVSTWADAALNTELRNLNHGNIEDYDMHREIRRLERIYCGYDPD